MCSYLSDNIHDFITLLIPFQYCFHSLHTTHSFDWDEHVSYSASSKANDGQQAFPACCFSSIRINSPMRNISQIKADSPRSLAIRRSVPSTVSRDSYWASISMSSGSPFTLEASWICVCCPSLLFMFCDSTILRAYDGVLPD